MNYLAHSIISIELDKNTLYGNFTGDFYKGRLDTLDIPKNIKNGISLHRKIDTLTDSEDCLTKLIDSRFGLYKGIMSDIFIDYFISNHFNVISNIDLKSYVISNIIPEIEIYSEYNYNNFNKLFIWMKENEILYNYGNINIIERVFKGLSKQVINGEILLEATDELYLKMKIFEEVAVNKFLNIKKQIIKLY